MRKTYESDDKHFKAGAYSVKGYPGVAWRVFGWETEPRESKWYDDEAEEWLFGEEPEMVRTGKVVAVMVGDDTRYAFDEDDIKPLRRSAYCGECGQIGCSHDGLDRRPRKRKSRHA